ncbi:MAG: DUF1963 domain-containing protein [Thermoguttaceae bacterium]|nr:DUF1963 domain-containing protein [Thermoguttaceae bacterium]
MDSESFIKILKRHEIGSVLLTYSDPANPLPNAASKFGGAPSLPPDVEWPTWEHPMFRRSWPLSFAAQINCREASPYDVDGLLPTSGMIYFFADVVCGANIIGDRKSWLVSYYNGPEDALKPREFPSEFFEKNYPTSIFVEKSISFSSQVSVPDLGELPFYDLEFDLEETYGSCESREKKYKELAAARQKCCGSKSVEFDHYFTERSFLLGYPDLIQSGLAPKIAADELGVDCIESPEEMEKFMSKIKEWTLLAQFGPIGKTHGMGEYEFIYADCGNYYFFIKKEDLKQKNFDAIWAESDCY